MNNEEKKGVNFQVFGSVSFAPVCTFHKTSTDRSKEANREMYIQQYLGSMLGTFG